MKPDIYGVLTAGLHKCLRTIRRNVFSVLREPLCGRIRLQPAQRGDHESRNGEYRIIALGYLDDRLHVLCFIPIRDGIRVISLRKANEREAKHSGKKKTTY
ncbi:BrnT family toxin [Terriglobus tenax]|uniref:BrnT family toxin n=1 Tax=Terriglobus tenax TaxID=1111115 RepID=UPI0037D9D137